jgi:hypothetical protein
MVGAREMRRPAPGVVRMQQSLTPLDLPMVSRDYRAGPRARARKFVPLHRDYGATRIICRSAAVYRPFHAKPRIDRSGEPSSVQVRRGRPQRGRPPPRLPAAPGCEQARRSLGSASQAPPILSAPDGCRRADRRSPSAERLARENSPQNARKELDLPPTTNLGSAKRTYSSGRVRWIRRIGP